MNAGSCFTLTKIVHDADFFELKIPVFMSKPQHFSWPLLYLSRTASRIWIGLSIKERQLSNSCYKTGILASEWLSQRPLSLCLIPAQHRGITTILQCPQEVCAMVGHGQGSEYDPECMAILRLLYILHLADIVTVQRHVRGYNHQKLFAQKYEERQQVSSKRINNNRAHCTSNICF
jgi:hypothetical protein